MIDINKKAVELQLLDELHLRFMGGDDYFTVVKLELTDDGEVEWWASNALVASMHDVCPQDQKVDVKEQ